MIAHWMLYCVAVGLLLGGGAAALERALAAFGRPTRWPWAAALLLTLAVPAAGRFLPRSADTASFLPVVVVSPSAPADLGTPIPEIGTPGTEAPRRDPRPALSLPSVDLSALDGPLLVFWRISSSVAVGVLAGLAIVLERRRRRWRAAEVDGVPVLVSPDTGPAVVGVLRTRIVLPEWACAVDERARALLLEHEREHVRAGDARLLAGGLLALALMPWNPALWWQLRRLRLAVEVDCDARVLRRGGDLRAYGALLLEVGRRAARSRLAAAGFSEPLSFLERRIRKMTQPRANAPWTRAAASGCAAALLAAAAFAAPGPRATLAAAVAPEPSAPSAPAADAEEAASPRAPSAAPRATDTIPLAVGLLQARRLYTAAGVTEPTLLDARSLRALVARDLPAVLEEGVPEGETVELTLDARGQLFGEAGTVDRPQLDTLLAAYAEMERAATDGAHLRVSRPTPGAPLFPVRTIDLLEVPAGVLGPRPVEVLLQRLDGDEGSFSGVQRSGVTRRGISFRLGSSGKAPLAGVPMDQDELFRLARANIPAEARAPGADGRVTLSFVVGTDGAAREMKAAGTPIPAVEAALRRVVSALRFYPDLVDGRPAEVRVDLTLDFGVLADNAATPVSTDPSPREREAMEAAVRRHHPEVARGRGAAAYWFLVDAGGRVARTAAATVEPMYLLAPGNAGVDRGDVRAVRFARVEIDGHYVVVAWYLRDAGRMAAAGA